MNIAIIQTGGKQYKVKEGQLLKIEKLAGEAGRKINFDKVLLLADSEGAQVTVGQPFVAGAKVEAEIVEQGRGDKILIIKYKSKTRYRRKRGHRQPFTKVKIGKLGGASTVTSEKKVTAKPKVSAVQKAK